MAEDISGFGFISNLQASNTFPNGFDISQFADDADPFDTSDIKLGDSKMGLNGDLIFWSVAAPIIVKIAVVPGSNDDQNLAALLLANRVGAGKSSAQDQITLTNTYPTGPRKTLVGGRITDGPVMSSVASAGRLKSKTYTFTFENVGGNPA
jgi:hypothetical protein